MRQLIFKYYLLSILLFSCPYIQAQNSNITFKHYNINDGLSQNTVYCMIEDKEGFMWMGTEDGLNRFDGYSFISYKHENNNPKSISANQINALMENGDGKIWVGTTSGLNIFNKKDESFIYLPTSKSKGESNEHITSICKDSKGNIWVGSFEGLKLFNPQTRNFTLFRLHNDSSSFEFNRTYNITESPDKLLWISGTRDFKRFDPINKKFIPLPPILENNLSLKRAMVRYTTMDSYGKIWIATENEGIFVYSPRLNHLVQYKHDPNDKNSLPANIARTIHFSNEHEVWIGTRDGLSIFNRKTNSFKNYTSDKYNLKSLSHNSVRSIIKDKAGNIWIGTFSGGINLYIPDNKFAYIGEQIGNNSGLSFKTIGALADEDKNSFWVGTEGAGLNFVKKDRSQFKTYDLPKNHINIFYNTVKSLFKDSDRLWIGTYKGLVSLNTKTMEFKEQPINSLRGVNAIDKTAKGLWLGTNGEGLINIDNNGNHKTYKHLLGNPQSLSRNNVIALLKDDKDNLWIGTEKGLNYFNNDHFKQYYYQPDNVYSLSSSNILSLYIDRYKRIWIGTKGGGLNLFDAKTNRFYAITEQQGLANNVIQSIEEDNAGNLWITTNRGLSRITLKNIHPPFNRENITITNYTVEDGLQSNQFSPNVSFKGENGTLYFGGINGINFLDPTKIKEDNFEPEVVFTDFLIRNQSANYNVPNSPLEKAINETTKLLLTYDQAFITLKFASLSYSNPGKNQYAYKMENLNNDDDWHYVGNQRTATFTNLNAGKYLLKIKASNSDGVWSSKIKTLEITVLPPWWKTWWAYLIYASIIGVLLYYFYYYSYKTANLKSQLAFENLSHLKDQELAQKTMNAYTNISHEIKTPLTLILAPLEKLIDTSEGNNKLMTQLLLIQRNGNRLLKLINQLLDFRKYETKNMNLEAEEGNIVSFTNEVLTEFNAYAKDKNIHLELHTQHPKIKLWFDKDKMEKVLYNLLSNALKFTPKGGHINITLTTEKVSDQEILLIKVIDDGLGIPPERIDKIFNQFIHYNENNTNINGSGIGLAFSKGLVELHYGELYVESRQPTNGQKGYTCFTVKLPLGATHLNENEMISERSNTESLQRFADMQSLTVTDTEILEKKKQFILKDLNKEKTIMLIVEDNQEVQQFIASHFEAYFQVITANDGAEGLKKAIEIMPDIMICDVMMPIMTGIELCSIIKTDPRTSHIPLILLTARTPLLYKIEGLETGADDYITKPFNLRMLETRVWNLLESRKILRDHYKQNITLQPSNLPITSADAKFLEKVIAYIEDNLTEPALNVEDLGKTIGMSRVTFYRKIKALTNQTTIEFIRNMRLKRAAQLLLQENFNINEIAYMVGFNDVDYFRKCFKEQFGHTPTEYLNLNSSKK